MGHQRLRKLRPKTAASPPAGRHLSPETGEGERASSNPPQGEELRQGPGVRAPQADLDRQPLPARAPRLATSLSLAYLVELARDEIDAARLRRAHRSAAPPAPGRSVPDTGTATGTANPDLPQYRAMADPGTGPATALSALGMRPALAVPPALRPELRWRHPISPRPGRRHLLLPGAILAVLLALLLLLLAVPRPMEEPGVEFAVLWQEGPGIVGLEQQGLLDPELLPMLTPPVPSPSAPTPAETVGVEELPDPLAAPDPIEPDPIESLAAEPVPAETAPEEAVPEEPLPEEPPLEEPVSEEPVPDAPEIAEDAPALPGEDGAGPLGDQGDAVLVPRPRPRPAPLVADIVIPAPDRPLPRRPAARPEPPPGAAPGAAPDGPPSALPPAPEGVQQMALRIFASDGPEPQRIRGFALPVYPIRARLLSLEGDVILRVEISQHGGPGHVWLEQSSGYPELDEAAFSAIQKWRFDPPTYRGTPVRAEMSIPVLFRLSRPDPR